MTADAEAEAWKAYAEASCMHDTERGRNACRVLACLIPPQRSSTKDVHTDEGVIQ